MALDYSILNTKKKVHFDSKFDETSKVEAYDLLGPSINIDDLNYGDYGLVEITKEYIARPDLVSLALYRDDKYADILCKINGISNPFELNEGMMLFYPTLPKLSQLLQNASSASNEFVKDPTTTSIQKMKNNGKKLVSEKRSPNEATVNDSNYVYSKEIKGILFY